ncbi:MAG: hypothetical protein ABI612_00450 [Betaproteobacteria bacterium]
MSLFSRAENLADKANLQGEFQSFVSDIDRVVKGLQQLASGGVSSARSELEDRVSRAKSILADTGRSATDSATRARDSMEGYVTERPWVALGAAIAIGAVVAVLLTRRGGK